MDIAMSTSINNPNWTQFFQGSQPKNFLYEDDQCFVIDEEYNKQAPTHFLVVPKRTVPRLAEATAEDEKLLGHMMIVAKQVAQDKGIYKSGYHVMVDENHKTKTFKAFHVFGRALHHMLWPMGPGSRL